VDIIDKKIQAYAEDHTSQETNLLSQINRETHANVLLPRMLSGHLQGRVLSMFSHMIKPKMILEIGTYTGYSALSLAEGIDKTGKLITIDVNEELEDQVRGYFKESEFNQLIDFRVGDALQIIPQLDNKFDLVFIDADKLQYQNYYELVMDKMNRGAFMIVDNVLWSGKVLAKDKNKVDQETRAIIEFNQMIQQDKRVENVLFPVRDGLLVLRTLV